MNALRLALQILLPLAVLALGWVLAVKILGTRAAPVVVPPQFTAPAVRVHVATVADVRIDVDTQGTVEPHRSIDLAAQVGGRIVAVAPALRAGGFFAAGEVLVAIERADYEFAVVQQEAAVARAELRLLQERAEADAAVRAWKELEGERAADPLVTRGPQIRDAEAALAAAKAQLGKARLDLARTQVQAPFAGRVQQAHVDLGQMVQPGQPLARIHDIDSAEVRLPIPATDAAFLALPLHPREDANAPGAPVQLVAEFGGARHAWPGTLVRAEAEVDRRTRQLLVVARVDAPYARGEDPGRPPLAVGTFVQARIAGRTFRDVVALPRTAVRNGDEAWVVDAEHRLRRRKVDVLRAEAERVLLRSGVLAGERVCITQLDTPSDGMPVRLAESGNGGGSPPQGR